MMVLALPGASGALGAEISYGIYRDQPLGVSAVLSTMAEGERDMYHSFLSSLLP